jgi:hypothetical protein
MAKPRGQLAGRDAPDAGLCGRGNEFSDRTQLAALWHLRYLGVSRCNSGQPLKGKIPRSIQRLEDFMRGFYCGTQGSDHGKAAKSALRLISHWTSFVTTCAK